jgi:hypothetical protein
MSKPTNDSKDSQLSDKDLDKIPGGQTGSAEDHAKLKEIPVAILDEVAGAGTRPVVEKDPIVELKD